jgi:dihydrofolate synthase / folylpolyglutamate synthase
VEPSAYRATLERLYARRRFGMRPGLDVIQGLLGALDHPERRYPAVHVTGSKGKGSVAVMTQAILRAHGLRTGLFTSPHLASYRERVVLDGRPIPKSAVVQGVARVEAAADALLADGTLDRPPTFFEVTTALALDWFARASADAAVVEVGIGGRLDATNVLDARVGVLTTIELEHTDLLGPTLEAIAREKSGILHPGMTGVVGEVPPGARREIESAAHREGVPLWHLGAEVRVRDRSLAEDGQSVSIDVPGHSLADLHVPLLGRFQAGNAALAVAASVRFLAALDRTWDDDAARRGIAAVRWPGRLQRVARRPELYYDVAHTPESARALVQSLAEISPMVDPAESAIVFGSLAGKDVPRILDALAPLARTIVLVRVRSSRALPVPDLRATATGRFPRVVVARDAAEALRLARVATGPEGLTLVTGSDYLIGELLRKDDGTEEPDLSDPGREPADAPPPSRKG